MAIFNVSEVRELFGVITEVSDSRILSCISAAATQLQSWIPSVDYLDADDADPTNTARAAALKAAGQHLVMYYLLLNTGIKTRVFGVGTSVESDMTADDLKALRRQFLGEAVVLSAPYRLKGVNPLATTLPILREIKDVM
jgi:hypothetical protein